MAIEVRICQMSNSKLGACPSLLSPSVQCSPSKRIQASRLPCYVFCIRNTDQLNWAINYSALQCSLTAAPVVLSIKLFPHPVLKESKEQTLALIHVFFFFFTRTYSLENSSKSHNLTSKSYHPTSTSINFSWKWQSPQKIWQSMYVLFLLLSRVAGTETILAPFSRTKLVNWLEKNNSTDQFFGCHLIVITMEWRER